MNPDALQEKIGYYFRDVALLHAALTHSSYANENRKKELSNERLEFLGDSVLGLLSAEYLFTHYSRLPEGDLTRIRSAVVCEESLYEIAADLGLGEYLLLGRGEEQNGGRERASILADATEALLGSIFLDGGLSAARGFIRRYLPTKIEIAINGRFLRDYKTALQEIVQKNPGETLTYRLVSETGPDHDKRFTVDVYLNSNPIARATGRSKKEAEQHAACEALALMGETC
jgi:ribonuclease-3